MQRNLQEVKSIIDVNIKKLIEEFNISLIYVFGSYAKGTNTENSDLDIGILINGDTSPMTRLSVLNEMVGILDREDIDLIILNEADEVLKFQVIKYGKLIYVRDLTEKVLFEARTMSEYMDMEHFRNTRNKYMDIRFKEAFGSRTERED
jgi:hypothetical protein